MSLQNFLNTARNSAVEVPAESNDVSTKDFLLDLSNTEVTSITKLSVTTEQAIAIKKAIAEYREEIKKGSFEPSTEKLHTIVMWFRISREEAFVLAKEKPIKLVKERATRKKKEVPIIGDLM